MTPEADKTIRDMDDLAERSLPPDLFELWAELKGYYDMRAKIDGDMDSSQEIPLAVQ